MTLQRVGFWASIATAAGIVASGPLALVVVARVAPQPPWQGVEVFVARYHPVQVLPFALGLLLVGGCVGLVIAAAQRMHRHAPTRAALARVAVGVFATLIAFNYIVQTTFVPALVGDSDPTTRPVLAAFTMANPRSLAWSLEMWGYAVLGLAGALVAPALRDVRAGRTVAALQHANAWVSLTGGVLAAARLDFIASPAGFAVFLAWNALMLVLALASAIAWRAAGLARATRP